MAEPEIIAALADGPFSLGEIGKSVQKKESGHMFIKTMNPTFRRSQKG